MVSMQSHWSLGGDRRTSAFLSGGATRNDIADWSDSAESSYSFFAGHLELVAGRFWFREYEAGDKLLPRS